MNKNVRHINEVESDRRGVKEGWYSIDAAGKLGSGPFPNHDDCLAHSERQQTAIDIYQRWKPH